MAGDMSPTRRNLLICLTLVVIALAVYGQVWKFGLVDLDDDAYIAHNPYVQLGLRSDSIRWAFTAIYEGNWHPMVWLSYLPDTEIARGLAARGIKLGPGNVGVYHLSNVAQHVASTLLLFFILLRMTGSPWRSAFVAAVFAAHPLHVESVAWVTERKDTLSALFWMLTILAYLNYVRNPSVGRFALVAISFAVGLMSKSMLVTLPLILLVIDYWPARRYELSTDGRSLVRSAWPLVREKMPLFALSAACGVVSFIAQGRAANIAPDEVFPAGVRVANALVSYVRYIWLTILPHDLSVCYVHPGRSLPIWAVVLSAVFVIGMTVLAVRFAQRVPYLTLGWLWFVITLLPVIGIVQIGSQALADRYAYIPMVGLLLIAAWGLPELLARIAGARHGLALAGCAAVVLLTLAAHKQVGYWRDSESLYREVVRVNPRSHIGYSGLGTALSAKGRQDEARKCLLRAIEIDPTDVAARINIGISLAVQGKLDQAVSYYQQAIDMVPGEPRANYNLGNIFVMQSKLRQAAECFRQAVASRPSFVEAHISLANVAVLLNRPDEAITHYTTAIRLKPGDANTHFHLAGVLEDRGRFPEAIDQYREAVRLDPKRWDAANNLAMILATRTDPKCSDPLEAVRLAETACRQVNNTQPALLDTLAVAYAAAGRYDSAAAAGERALGLATSAKQTRMAEDIRARLRIYRNHSSPKS